MSDRTNQRGSYLSNETVLQLNEDHGWFKYEDAQSDVSRAFANNAVHAFLESAKEAESVKQETGLTPRQLAEQSAELLEALKGMVEVFGNQEHVLTLWEVIDAKAAIAKVEAAQ